MWWIAVMSFRSLSPYLDWAVLQREICRMTARERIYFKDRIIRHSLGIPYVPEDIT